MENVTEALKMAAAVLVFVVALGISISSFSEARQTSDMLVRYNDREYVTQYMENTGKKTREVSLETIIPTLYRAYKENFTIYFYRSDGTPLVLYKYNDEEINYINSGGEAWALANDTEKDYFIMALLYVTNTQSEQGLKDFVNNLKDRGITLFRDLNPNSLYDTIKEEKFQEEYGIYYQEDVVSGEADYSTDEEDSTSSVPDANKTKKRVITYIMQG